MKPGTLQKSDSESRNHDGSFLSWLRGFLRSHASPGWGEASLDILLSTSMRRRIGRAVLLPAILAAFWSISLAASAPPSADSVSLRAGIAKADITPDPQMLNWTLTPARPYGEVHDPLFVRALVLADSATRVAVIGWDLLDAREFAVARVREAVSKATGIPPRHIIVQASHNHSGPKSEMGPEANTAREQRTSRPVQEGPAYREWADRLVTTCVDVARRANESLQPADLYIGRASVAEWLFNRRPIRPDQTVQSTLLPPNPYVLAAGLRFGLVDPTMTVLSLRSGSGQNIALLFH